MTGFEALSWREPTPSDRVRRLADRIGFGTAKYGRVQAPRMSDDHDHDDESGRVTAPMQEYGTSEVTTGFVVLLVGVAVAYALPALF